MVDLFYMETLALMAARGDSEETQDGETYIEKYTRGVLEVENILSLERLRQVHNIIIKCDLVQIYSGCTVKYSLGRPQSYGSADFRESAQLTARLIPCSASDRLT